MSKDALTWLTPILAAITFLLDGGHLVHLIGPEWLVLIAAGVTAIVGFLAAIKKDEPELPAPVQQIKPGGPQK